MKLATVRRFALSLPGVTEEPHFTYFSFRVHSKIFVTVPPDEAHIHIFIPEPLREQALALHPEYLEKLMWGKKAVGVRVALAAADREVIQSLVKSAWTLKASTQKSFSRKKKT